MFDVAFEGTDCFLSLCADLLLKHSGLGAALFSQSLLLLELLDIFRSFSNSSLHLPSHSPLR